MTDDEFIEASNKLHNLVRMTCEDMVLIKKDSRYKFDVNYYHSGTKEFSKCHACVAGSLMAGRLGLPSDSEVSTGSFRVDIGRRLRLIDAIRRGAVSYEDLEMCGYSRDASKILDDNYSWALRAGNGTAWRKLQQELEKANL